MKTYGKDKDYRKALYKNLIGALRIHKKIKTTLSKAKKIKREFLKKNGGKVKVYQVGERWGDGAEMVILEWIKENLQSKNENKTNKITADKKRVASY